MNNRKIDINYFIQYVLLENKAALIVIFISIILSFASPYFLTTQNILNVIRQVCVITLLSVGFTITIASAHFDLSLGYMMGLLGVILGKLIVVIGVPWPLSIVLIILIGGLFGLINGVIITYLKINAFIATLATGSVFQATNYLISKLVPISGFSPGFIYIGQGYFFGIPVPVYIMIIVVTFFYLLIVKTKFGRHVVAMGGNPEASRVLGINLDNMRLIIYTITGMCTGIAAIVLTARTASAQIAAGSTMILDAIAAVVIGGTSLWGGKANIYGTMFGCLVVGVVNNGLNLLGVNPNWQIMAKGLMILFAVVLQDLVDYSYTRKSRKLEVK